MTRLALRIAHAPRAAFPEDDDALGERLWEMLVEKLPVGVPRPALFTFFPEVVQIVDLPPLLAAGGDVHRALSAFASQDGATSLAALGVMNRARRGVALGSYAVAFLEWPDGRWWSSAQPLDADRRLHPDAPRDVQRAVDGAPKPGGLGAWFRRARYEELRLRIETGEPVN